MMDVLQGKEMVDPRGSDATGQALMLSAPESEPTEELTLAVGGVWRIGAPDSGLQVVFE